MVSSSTSTPAGAFSRTVSASIGPEQSNSSTCSPGAELLMLFGIVLLLISAGRACVCIRPAGDHSGPRRPLSARLRRWSGRRADRPDRLAVHPRVAAGERDDRE